MPIANRLDQLPPYLFLEISRKIQEKRSQGIDVVSFGIGDPDIPTPPHIVNALSEAALLPINHRYPESDGLPEFRAAIADWYERRFDVRLDPRKEVVPLIGAKEGIGHMALCTVDPGGVALVPDPGYPVYSVGTTFAGGTSYFVPLVESEGWLPNLDLIPKEVAQKASVLWLNYPNNPTGGLATEQFFEKVVSFARRYDLIVCHDAAYSEVTFENYVAPSFLQTPGAIDIGIEFHSLSKTYNMTGWRVGMAVGNKSLVDALIRVKSNLDSGIPQAIQQMGIEALSNTTDDWLTANNAIYQRRRDQVLEALRSVGLEVATPLAGLYVWAKVPPGWTSASLATEFLERHSIVVTPGRAYGEHGEGYIRLSLTTPDDRLDEGLRRIKSWQIPNIS